MKRDSRIYVAGHRGLAGSALVRRHKAALGALVCALLLGGLFYFVMGTFIVAAIHAPRASVSQEYRFPEVDGKYR